MVGAAETRHDETVRSGPSPAAGREADHRIANSLAFLAATLRAESRRVASVDEARAALTGGATRLNAVSRLHFALARHRDGPGTVDLAQNLAEIAGELSESLDMRISVACAPRTVPLDLAGGLDVIVSELAMNALKHSGACRPIRLDVSVAAPVDTDLRVTVRDNGVGLPTGFDMEDTAGLGMAIVTSTVRRLGGRVTPDDGPCACFRIDLPL